MTVAIMLAAAAGVATAISGGERVELDGGVLRLRDLGQLAGFSAAARSAGADRGIASLPAGRSMIVVTRADLAALVRRATPASVDVADPDAPVTIVRRVRAPGGCVVAARRIAAGETVTRDDLEPADCGEAAARTPLRYRSGEGVVAPAAIAAGTPLGRLAPPTPPSVARGSELTLVSRMGPVTISRGVTALQAGRSGQKIFVRDPDGAVFSVPVDVREEEGR